jgi:hypothetical protein
MPSAPLLLSQAFNGLALGTLLALVSSGLTIILGTLGVLNFAHGALFMVGAYLLYVVAAHTGSFVAGLFAGAAFMLLAGAALERGLIRWFYAGRRTRSWSRSAPPSSSPRRCAPSSGRRASTWTCRAGGREPPRLAS